MCLVVSLGLGIYNRIRIATPGFTVEDYMLWQSDEYFLMYNPDMKALPVEERTALRESYRLTALKAERRSALQRLVFVAIIILVDAVVYGVHWRVASLAEPRPPSAVSQQHSA